MQVWIVERTDDDDERPRTTLEGVFSDEQEAKRFAGEVQKTYGEWHDVCAFPMTLNEKVGFCSRHVWWCHANRKTGKVRPGPKKGGMGLGAGSARFETIGLREDGYVMVESSVSLEHAMESARESLGNPNHPHWSALP